MFDYNYIQEFCSGCIFHKIEMCDADMVASNCKHPKHKGWKDNENNIISVAKFNYADRDATEYRVCEYFGGGYELKSRK